MSEHPLREDGRRGREEDGRKLQRESEKEVLLVSSRGGAGHSTVLCLVAQRGEISCQREEGKDEVRERN